ncbi:RNA polymerase sigma factor [Labilibacter marinus]|uniref:RNA polymerase sigma factor n=1 Tax=Labilibacter marinus TaxID=1477105 RepID=UPI00094FAFBE|nr:RNA polymerase sigma factor [Labilibacter marinus]
MDNQSDKIVLKQIKQGDVSAYSVLVNRYRNMAFTLAASITKNNEDAEEVAQDAFVKAYKNLGSFKGKSKFSTWLYQIVYRTALSKMRIKKQQVQSIDEKTIVDVNLNDKQPDNLERSDRKKIIKIAINQLKEDESFLLILYYYQELSMEELAEATGYSVSNVKVKLHRARKNMYEQLQVLMNGQAKSLIQL